MSAAEAARARVAAAMAEADAKYAASLDPTCRCGHLYSQHQTGEGPWTGFCYGILADLGPEYAYPGSDPNEPCACEAPRAEDDPS